MTLSTMQWRVLLAVLGIALGLFGIFRLLTQIAGADLMLLAVWLIGALVLHDGLLSPVVGGIGWVIAHVVPPRARRFLQPGLIVGALITVIALPEIYRRNSQPASKGILRQDYSSNLVIALGIVTVVMVVAYAVQVVRERAAIGGGEVRRPTPGPGRSVASTSVAKVPATTAPDQRPSDTNGRPSTDQESSSE
ncbi:MAG: hypothetical protein ABI345_04795 [Jatrophihabitans sp.]